MSSSSRSPIIVVTTNQRVGVLSGGHRWRWTAERARRYVERDQGTGPRPCDMRVVKDDDRVEFVNGYRATWRGRWAVVCFQNYATDSEEMASWIRALDVELTAGDITKAQFETEVARYSDILRARVSWPWAPTRPRP